MTKRAAGFSISGMGREKAVFAGSFDPPTFGHLNIIERAGRVFSELHVVIAVNSEKSYLFSEDERLSLMRQLVFGKENISVHSWDSLIVEYAKKVGAGVLIRGVRNLADFSYEFDLAMMNRGLSPEIETVFLPTDPEYFILRSSAIKELARFGGDVSTMVPEIVAEALHKKYLA